MAESYISRTVRVRRSAPKSYRWNEVLLFLLLFILLVCAAITLGAFAYIEYVQRRLLVAIPWYFYFVIVVCALTLAYILLLVALYYIHLLLPIIVAISGFVFFVLWLVGLVKTSIELWGPTGSVNDNCVRYVYSDGFWGGRTIDTLARIQQEGVCNLWKTAFAMEMIGTFLLIWLVILSWQVMTRKH